MRVCNNSVITFDDADAVLADAHEIAPTRQHDALVIRPDEAPLREVPVDAQPIRHGPDHLFADTDRAGPEKFRIPVPARFARQLDDWCR